MISNYKLLKEQGRLTEVNYTIFEYSCLICDSYVSSKSKHCGACNKCVAEFDHHCEWLNNCIG